MLTAIFRECRRQISEYKQFKVNLFFANISIFFLVTGLLDYFEKQGHSFVLFSLLFAWYFATHGITHPTYFIEDEILDRTLITVIQSKSSIFGMMFMKMLVQILLDLLKAIPLFSLIAIFQGIHFPGLYMTIMLFCFVMIIVFAVYGLGFLFSSFVLIWIKMSNMTNLLAYGILLFLGLQEVTYPSLVKMGYLFPFHLLHDFVSRPSFLSILLLLAYVLLYWGMGFFCFHICLKIAKKKGTLFYV